MTAPAFDTVIVPDFRDAERTGRFEPQTLLFLASWMEHAGQASHWPVHVACIGQPPTSVRALAEQCGAAVSVHEPPEQELGRFSNKLRAWDVEMQTNQLLYLDADMLCLGPPVELAQWAGAMAGAPAGLPRVPASHGRTIDAALGLTPWPHPPMRAAFAEARIPLVGPRYGSENAYARSMWPLLNGGLLFVAADVPMRQRWIEHWQAIARTFDDDDPMWADVVESDMTAMITAMRTLEYECNCPLRILSPQYNTRWMHLAAGTMNVRSSVLFHAVNLCRQPVFGPNRMEHALVAYDRHLQRISRRWAWRIARYTGRLDRAAAMVLRSASQRRALLSVMHGLTRRHIAPVLDISPVSVP